MVVQDRLMLVVLPDTIHFVTLGYVLMFAILRVRRICLILLIPMSMVQVIRKEKNRRRKLKLE